jgi:putative flippase GtrA
VTVLARLRDKYDVVAREAAKFGAVGAVNTVLDFAVLNLLVFGFGVQPLRSKVASTVVAATSSYLMNRHWTFRHRERQDVRREYVLFFLLNAVGLGISLAVIGVVRYGFGLDGALWINLANVVGIGFGTLFRFWSYRKFVWTAADQVQEAAEDGDTVAAVVLDTTQPRERAS